MPKRMTLILVLLVALALACTRRAPVQIDLPRLQLGTSSPETQAPGTPTLDEVFLPEVSTGADQTQAAADQTQVAADQTSAARAAASIEAPAAETATAEAPAVSETPDASAVQGTEGVQPPPTEAPQAAATPAAPNTLYLPIIYPGRDGEAAEPVGGQSPSIDLEATPVILQVGATLTVAGRPSGIGMPYYQLSVQDQGSQQAQVLGQVTYENVTMPQSGLSQILELVSAEGTMDQATFVLRGKAPGTAAVQMTATGEVQTESGAYTWSGGSSQAIAVTVNGE